MAATRGDLRVSATAALNHFGCNFRHSGYATQLERDNCSGFGEWIKNLNDRLPGFLNCRTVRT